MRQRNLSSELNPFEKGRLRNYSTADHWEIILSSRRLRLRLARDLERANSPTPSIEYEKLTNTPEHYLENTKIVDRKDLQLLSKLGFYEVL